MTDVYQTIHIELSRDDAEKLDQIRKAHASAMPTDRNPAWLYTHRDLGFILQLMNKGEIT
jgi:hypothetical protein